MADLPAEQREAVEQFVTDWATDNRIPGAAVAVVDGDDVAYAEGFGARDLESNEPATPQTLFPVASCTKSFTAAAVMQLVERGAVAVEDPVDDFIPHLTEAPGEPITVRELLSHTSGLPAHLSSPQVPGPDGLDHLEVPLSSRADFRRLVEGAVDRRVTDRETLFYYNAGYTLLGLLVEAVTGQAYAEYVDEHLLEPLGMDRSTFDEATAEADGNRMRAYVKDDGSSRPSGFPDNEFVRPAGGLLTSVEELATWLRVLKGGGSSPAGSVLAPESVAEMTTPVGTFHTFFDGRTLEYGYGLSSMDYLDDRVVGHGGSLGVSNAYFGWLEDADLGVVVACGTRPEAHVLSLGLALLAILQSADPEDVVPHYRLLSALERVTGDYETYPDIGEVSVERAGGQLRIAKDFGFGGEERVVTPTEIGQDRLVCRSLGVDGMEHDARFEFREDEVLLFEDRDRFRKSI